MVGLSLFTNSKLVLADITAAYEYLVHTYTESTHDV